MAMLAFAFPILPGKKDQWLSLIEQIRGPRKAEFNALRERAGVHERTFLQETPHGDLVVVTLEGEDPAAAMGVIMTDQSALSTWFLEQAKEIHGMDPSAGPPSMPRLVVDTRG